MNNYTDYSVWSGSFCHVTMFLRLNCTTADQSPVLKNCYSSQESAIIVYIQISTYILAFWSNIAFDFAFVNIQLLVSENYADPEPWLETMTVERVCEFLDNGSAYRYTNYGCVFNFDLKNHLILWINSAKKNFKNLC